MNYTHSVHDVALGLSLREAQQPRRTPSWDLFVVLDAMRRPPFEPLHSASFKFLTMKTSFLLPLASGRRRSEIHTLRGAKQDIPFLKDKSIQLKFLPEFLAKSQCPGDPSPMVLVRSVAAILSKDDQDRPICPESCLRFYLDRSSGRRLPVHRRILLPSRNDLARDISAASVSRWIVSTVAVAYAEAAHSAPLLSRPRAHETRAIAASVAFQNATPIVDILEAVYWKSVIPFIDFYLRDLQCTRGDGTYGISSLVAA